MSTDLTDTNLDVLLAIHADLCFQGMDVFRRDVKFSTHKNGACKFIHQFDYAEIEIIIHDGAVLITADEVPDEDTLDDPVRLHEKLIPIDHPESTAAIRDMIKFLVTTYDPDRLIPPDKLAKILEYFQC